jgi:hypothetical protein
MSGPILMPIYAFSHERLVLKLLSPFKWGYRLQAGPYTIIEVRMKRARTAERDLMITSRKDSIQILERGTLQELAVFKRSEKKGSQSSDLEGTLVLASGETLSWRRLPRTGQRVWQTPDGEQLIAFEETDVNISPGASLHPELALLLVVGMYLYLPEAHGMRQTTSILDPFALALVG